MGWREVRKTGGSREKEKSTNECLTVSDGSVCVCVLTALLSGWLLSWPVVRSLTAVMAKPPHSEGYAPFLSP